MLPHFNVWLTNRMWFSVVCTLIDNDMRHHSGQNVVDSRGAIWLVYSLKWAFLIGYYNKKQLPQEFWIERGDRKVERFNFITIQLQLFSYCKYSSRTVMILRHISYIIVSYKVANNIKIKIWEHVKVIHVWELKKALRDTLTRAN